MVLSVNLNSNWDTLIQVKQYVYTLKSLKDKLGHSNTTSSYKWLVGPKGNRLFDVWISGVEVVKEKEVSKQEVLDGLNPLRSRGRHSTKESLVNGYDLVTTDILPPWLVGGGVTGLPPWGVVGYLLFPFPMGRGQVRVSKTGSHSSSLVPIWRPRSTKVRVR